MAKEAFRHVSGALSAPVADLDDVPRRRVDVSHQHGKAAAAIGRRLMLLRPFIVGSGLL